MSNLGGVPLPYRKSVRWKCRKEGEVLHTVRDILARLLALNLSRAASASASDETDEE